MKISNKLTAFSLAALLGFSAVPLCGNTLSSSGINDTVIGDVNGDSLLSVADILMLQKWLLGTSDITLPTAADLCKDGVIDVYDLVLMRKALLGTLEMPAGNIDITLNGISGLHELRSKLELPDDELADFLASYNGGSLKSREELESMIAEIDDIPFPDFYFITIDDIGYKRISNDGEEQRKVFLKLGLPYGEWVYLEYDLSAENALDAIKKAVENEPDALLDNPVISGNIGVYAESRSNGSVSWYVDYKNLYVKATYESNDIGDVNTKEIMDSVPVNRLGNK